MRLILSACFALMTLAQAAWAQGTYDPVITVNGDAITAYELRQRQALLRAFNTPGDLAQLARDQLIEDRLKAQELRRRGVTLADEDLRTEMQAFAARANLSYAQFLQILAQNQVAEETLRDFVRSGVTWRDYIRARYTSQVEITEQDVDRALGRPTGGATVEVLLSEIIIPAPPQMAARAQAEARRISAMRSTAAFEAAARQVSALPSGARGGRLGWVPITNYPAALRPILLGLSRGEVTAPLPVENGIALFQMRGVRERQGTATTPTSVEYLTFSLPGGMSDRTQAEAARIASRIDTCDDFYGIAKSLPPERLLRQSVAPSQIPGDVAQVLAGLDANELSYGLTRNNGQDLIMVMLCTRSYAAASDEDRQALGNQLLGQRLEGYSNALIARLKSEARIR